MIKYKSKIGKGLVSFLIIIFTGLIVLLINDFSLIGLAIILLLVSFIVNIFLSTFYTVDNGMLFIKCGIFYTIKIQIESIRKITETNTVISSPALSLDRIEIVYNKYDSVIISPKNKQKFIDKLLAINPKIEIFYKKKT